MLWGSGDEQEIDYNGRCTATLLGGFAARQSDGAPASLPSRKAEALLAFLGCRPGEPQPRERLTTLLWGDRSDSQARHSLSQALCSIRRTFGDAVTLVAANWEAVTLCPDAAHVDVAEFQALGAGDAVEDLQAPPTSIAGRFSTASSSERKPSKSG